MPTKVTDAKTYYNYKNNTDKLMTISDKLRFYRLQNGLEQKDVAKIIGINRSDYIGYENLTQKELANLLNVQLVCVKRWESEKNRILKFNWEKLLCLL